MSWLSSALEDNFGWSKESQGNFMNTMSPLYAMYNSGGGMNQNFNYTPSTRSSAQINTNQLGQTGAPNLAFLNQAMGSMNQTAGGLSDLSGQMQGMGQGLYDQGQSFLTGDNPLYARMRGQMVGDLSAQAAQSTRQGSEALATMGAGSAGLRNMLKQKQMNTAMGNVASGYEGMLNAGLGHGTALSAQGMQGMGQAGNLLNMAGGLYQGAGGLGLQGQQMDQQSQQFNASALNQALGQNAALMQQGNLANMQAQNEAAQFGIMGNYNQNLADQQSSDSFWNNAISAGATVLPYALSDINVKHDITHVGRYNYLPVYTFRYNHDPDTLHTGFMAQDVEKVYPSAVLEIDGIKHVKYGELLWQ
mgnify:CR=1 FL=1